VSVKNSRHIVIIIIIIIIINTNKEIKDLGCLVTSSGIRSSMIKVVLGSS
jgi:hypothetical protein